MPSFIMKPIPRLSGIVEVEAEQAEPTPELFIKKKTFNFTSRRLAQKQAE